MEVANLPAIQENSSVQEADDRYLEAIADQIAAGHRPDDIARRIHPNDPAKRKKLRRRIWYSVYHDQRLAERIGIRAHGELLLALVPATMGLARKAKRGDVQAVKLLTEASGFHNPRIKHDHTGSIEVKLTMPRPERPEIPDAEVVEDSS